MTTENLMAKNLHQRLVDAKKEVKDLGKSGQAPAAMGGYRFTTWDDAGGSIGELFAKHGISYKPSMPEARTEPWGTTSTGKPIYRATVKMEYTLTNADEPSEKEVSMWWGIADDTSDKNVQQAATNATKYFLMKLFNLTGAEDTESIAIDRGEVQRPAQQRQAPAAPTPQQPAEGGTKKRPLSKVSAGRNCPECGSPLELATWPGGGQTISCSNFRECRYREKVAMVQGPTTDEPYDQEGIDF